MPVLRDLRLRLRRTPLGIRLAIFTAALAALVVCAAFAALSIQVRAALVGITWYAETKYTFTPRLYAAARVERNDYPFIMPIRRRHLDRRQE